MSLWGWLTERSNKSRVQNPLDTHLVSDKSSFLKFIAALEVDLSSNPAGWENPDMPRFLNAMARWTVDWKQGHNSNPWRHAADLLMAARTYE